MPIPLQCPQCRRAYRLDDRLAGQTVRCKDCGAAIVVPAPGQPPELPLEPSPQHQPAIPDLRSLFGAAIPESPATPPQSDVDFRDAAAQFKKRRWTRTPGNPTLESLDELLKALGFLIILAGISVWVVHIAKSPTGLSVTSLLPLLLTLLVLAGVMAPIATLTVNAAVRLMKLAPRDDTYTLAAVPFLLPFAAAMLAATPGMEGRLDGLTTLAWFLAPALLLYFFRADVLEWSLSVAVLILALGLGLIAAGIASSLAASFMNTPLYVDMLPPGPWTSLAKGHSPPPPPDAPPATLAATTSATTTAPAPSPIATPTPPAPSPLPDQTAKLPAIPDPVPAPPAPVKRTPVSRNLISPFLTDILPNEPGFTAVSSVVAPSPPMGSILIIRNADNEATVEKWDLASTPPEKKSKITFPLFPKKPHVYDLSPKGDTLVALCFFPRSQLDISTFDGKTPRKIVPLDVPDASPSLLGFSDSTHFFIRWDATSPSPSAGNVRLQQWNTLNAQPSRLSSPMSVAPGSASMLISPSGHLVATFERDHQLALYNLDSGLLTRRIRPTDLGFSLLGMAFSPDSSQIALYGIVADVPTILSFKTQTGAPVATAVLPAPKNPAAATTSKPADAAPSSPLNHPLLWIQTSLGTDAWLVNGNDFRDTTTGHKFASLDLPQSLDQQLVATSTLLFQLPADTDDTFNLVLAHLDEPKLQAAANKSK